MGIIKTAVASGVAIYAIKEISKTANARYQSQSVPRDHSHQDETSPRQIYHQSNNSEDGYQRAEKYQQQQQQQQQPMYLNNAQDDAWTALPSSYYSNQGQQQRAISGQSHEQSGFVEPEYYQYERADGDRSRTSGGSWTNLAPLAQQAMSFYQQSNGGKGGKKDNVMDMLSRFSK